MESLLETIRIAVTSDATEDARSAGASACRTILATLESKPGEPLEVGLASQPNVLATMVTALRGMPPDQLIDLAIARLRAALPAGEPVANVQPLKFNLIPVPPLTRNPR
ncbi:MAG: hypothetical protein NT062_38205 [Proteobacteria bacterium]|nr:hypothetical protein [Pseudomonadota bacterium]